MTESAWITLIALGEAAFLLAIALAVVAAVVLRRRRRDETAANTLAERIRDQAPARRDALSERLSDQRGLDAEQAQAAAADVVTAETDFLRTLLRTYRRRDGDRLANMDSYLHDLGRHYEGIPTSAPEPEPETDNGDGDTEALRAELDALKGDMRLYRDALNRVFAEYTAMFGTEIDRSAQLSATEILQRLDSGELGGKPAESSKPDEETSDDDGRVSDEELDRLIQDL